MALSRPMAAQHGVGLAPAELEQLARQMSIDEKRAGSRLFDALRRRAAAAAPPLRLLPALG